MMVFMISEVPPYMVVTGWLPPTLLQVGFLQNAAAKYRW
jgi:hypothetical protein